MYSDSPILFSSRMFPPDPTASSPTLSHHLTTSILKFLSSYCFHYNFVKYDVFKQYLQRGGVKMAEEQDGRSLSLLQIHRKNNRTVNKVYKTTADRQQRTSDAQKSCSLSSKGGEKFVFLLSFFLFFLLFFLFSFLLLVFLSYFLLKSSNTPLLFLNFHFHLNITLQKKRKKKREREAVFFN